MDPFGVKSKCTQIQTGTTQYNLQLFRTRRKKLTLHRIWIYLENFVRMHSGAAHLDLFGRNSK